MRYPRTKPPIVLAIVAALAVASPFAVTYFGADPVPVDRTNTAGMTSVEEISLADLPTYALDIATSGLADLGIKLPTIDPALFPDPETGRTAPAPPREPSAPPTRESSAPPRGSLPDTEVVRTPAPRTVNPCPARRSHRPSRHLRRPRRPRRHRPRRPRQGRHRQGVHRRRPHPQRTPRQNGLPQTRSRPRKRQRRSDHRKRSPRARTRRRGCRWSRRGWPTADPSAPLCNASPTTESPSRWWR